MCLFAYLSFCQFNFCLLCLHYCLSWVSFAILLVCLLEYLLLLMLVLPCFACITSFFYRLACICLLLVCLIPLIYVLPCLFALLFGACSCLLACACSHFLRYFLFRSFLPVTIFLLALPIFFSKKRINLRPFVQRISSI